MAMNKDLRKFLSGMNKDDNPGSPDFLPGDYLDALNMRIASSNEQQGVGMAETLQGEIEILINAHAQYYGGAIGGEFIYDGYEEVTIGNQVWMKRNYAKVYPGDKTYNDNEDNRDIYGALYNWQHLQENDFLPVGWRVPTEADIDELLSYVGGAMIAGGRLKEYDISHWTTPNTDANDQFGFTALPGGMFDTVFSLLGLKGSLWIADEGIIDAPVALPATSILWSSFYANWEASNLAAGYYLDVATDIGFTSMVSAYDKLDVGNVLTYPVIDLFSETTYYYRLTAYLGTNESSYSNIITTTTIIGFGLLYNWYAASAVDYGALYNWYAVNDARFLLNTGWHVPSTVEWNAMAVFLGATESVYPLGGMRIDTPNIVGDKLKEIGTLHWVSDVGSTNSSGFNGVGGGVRGGSGFSSLGIYAFYWCSDDTSLFPFQVYGIDLDANSHNVSNWTPGGADNRYVGQSVRGVKDSTSLTNGQTGTYIGNDGKVYRTICIDNKEWIADNLKETKYRNSDTIPEVTDNATWAALTTGAMCYYNNNINNSRSIVPTGWHALSEDEMNALRLYLDPVNIAPMTDVAGARLKCIGTDFWNNPNTGASNNVGFNAKGSGVRTANLGKFVLMKLNFLFWNTKSYIGGLSGGVGQLAYNNAFFTVGYILVNEGSSIRCAKNTTVLTDGQTSTVTDIDGNIYNTVCINGVEYMAENLKVTHYNDGSDIPEVTDNAAWVALTTGALCAYNNDWHYV